MQLTKREFNKLRNIILKDLTLPEFKVPYGVYRSNSKYNHLLFNLSIEYSGLNDDFEIVVQPHHSLLDNHVVTRALLKAENIFLNKHDDDIQLFTFTRSGHTYKQLILDYMYNYGTEKRPKWSHREPNLFDNIIARIVDRSDYPQAVILENGQYVNMVDSKRYTNLVKSSWVQEFINKLTHHYENPKIIRLSVEDVKELLSKEVV